MPSSAYICKIAFRQLIIEMVIWWDSVTVSLLLLLFWNIVRNPKNSDCETSWLVYIWYDCVTLLVNTCCWKRIFCSVSSWNVFIVWESTKNILIYLLHLHFWRGSVWYCKFSFGHTMVFRYLAHKSSDLSILVDSQQWIPSKLFLTRAKAIEWLMGMRLSLAPCTTNICFPINRLSKEKIQL